MCKAIDDMKQTAREEGFKSGVQQGIEQGTLLTLNNLISLGKLSLEVAVNSVSMTSSEFLAAIEKYTS